MSPDQLPLYHVNRKKWEAARKARGLSFDAAALDALKRRKIGRVCSSKQMSSHDLDEMLAGFAAVVGPDDLPTQLHIAESPERRKFGIELKIMAALEVIVTDGNPDTLQPRRLAYAGGTARKVCGKSYEQLDEDGLRKLMGVLGAQRDRLVARAAEATVDPDNVPF